MSLTDKQKAFCHEYLVDLNATLAYGRAGYAGNKEAARRNGSKLLTNIDIQAEIQRLQGLRAKRTDITADNTLKRIHELAHSNIFPVLKAVEEQQEDNLSIEVQKTVKQVKRKNYRKETSQGVEETYEVVVTMHDVLRPVEMLAQHLGMLSDLNVAIATLKTYGEVEKTDEGYRIILNAQNPAANQS